MIPLVVAAFLVSLVPFRPAAATATAIAASPEPDPTASPTAAVSPTTIPFDRYQGMCFGGQLGSIDDYNKNLAGCFQACVDKWGERLHNTIWRKDWGGCYCHESCDFWDATCKSGLETAFVPGKTVPEHPGCDPCIVCPDGATAGDDFVIPDTEWGDDVIFYRGVTCGVLMNLGKEEEKDSSRCARFKHQEFICCPDQQAENPCPFCPGGITAEESFVFPAYYLWRGRTCIHVKGEAAITRESSERCSEEMKLAESDCCPMSTMVAESIERKCTQMLEIETGKEFSSTEAATYELVMESYTEQFGHMVGKPQIATTCNVTGHEAVGRSGRGLQSDLPVSYPMAINFTIRYDSRYGYDVDDYPQQFQSYINNNLQQVTADMSWVIEAKEVTVFDSAGLTGTQTRPSTGPMIPSSITKNSTVSPTFVGTPTAGSDSTAALEQSPITTKSRENPASTGLIIGLVSAGALIVVLLILYKRRQRNLQREAQENDLQEEDRDVPGWPTAAAFDFVFSNKTESDTLCLEVINKLTSHGLTIWQQRTNIPKDTDNWFNEWFPSAIRARKIVCFVTVEYLKSPYCMREFGIALNSNRLLVVACEPLNKINEVDPSDYPHSSNALAYLINGGQVIFHDSEDVVAEILKFADSTNDEEAGAHPDLHLVDKTHLMNGGQVLFHASKDMVAKNLGGSSVTEEFDFVFSNKTESDALCLGVRDKLMSHGITVWQQRTNIPKDSDNWFDEWFQSARKARKIVCFLTADYIKSPFCMKEFGIALNTNKLLAVACDPLAKINEVDPSAYPKASNALAYLINGGEVIIHDSEDVVAEILKFATNPGEANPNDAEAEA